MINGKKIKFDGNVVINVKRDITPYKEKKFDADDKSRMLIEINGDMDYISCNNANILVNGNVNKVIIKDGNVNCNDIKGKVVCSSINCNNVKGDINTIGDIVCETFIGNTNIGKVIDKQKPIKNKNILKEGLTVYHKKYGKGIINNIWNYNKQTSGSMQVKFDSEEYSKTLFIDSIIKNNSLSIYNNEEINNEYEEELI